jgi:hypothetical protein
LRTKQGRAGETWEKIKTKATFLQGKKLKAETESEVMEENTNLKNLRAESEFMVEAGIRVYQSPLLSPKQRPKLGWRACCSHLSKG